MEGYIKLYRSLLDWEWYDDPNTMRLFLHILLKANYTDKQWRGITIKRGQLLTSIANLAKETKLSPQKVRTVLEKLKLTQEITSYTTSLHTILEVIKYDSYQGESTNEQQTSNKPTTNEQQQLKNTKKDKKEKKTETSVFISEYSERFQTKYLEWVEYRKQSKKKLTQITIDRQIAKCREWGEENAIKSIDTAIERQWQGLFPYEDTSKVEKKPRIDYEAEKKKTLEREKQARIEKRKEQDESDRKKREDDKILRWIDSLPESRQLDIEKEVNESQLVTRLKMPPEDAPESEKESKMNIINSMKRQAKMIIARKYYFQNNT